MPHFRLAMPLMLAGLAAVPPAAAAEPSFYGRFTEVTETGFVLEALADPETIGPYAICKAASFVNKMKRRGAQFALTFPVDIPPAPPPMAPFEVPADWRAIRTTAHIVPPFPDNAEAFDLAQWTADCERGFEWFR